MNRMTIALAAIFIGSVLTSSSVSASTSVDELSSCLADNTTGKDRKDMARWIFLAMSSHPEISSFTNISEQKRDEVNMLMGAMVTKLMTESCPVQVKKAMGVEGGQALKTAFGVLGRLAMQELMTNTEVNSSFSGFTKYIDKSKMESAFSKK
jgi:hypothetical protein